MVVKDDEHCNHQHNWHRPHASFNQLPPIRRARLDDNNLLMHHI
jgi:hypothetical protein